MLNRFLAHFGQLSHFCFNLRSSSSWIVLPWLLSSLLAFSWRFYHLFLFLNCFFHVFSTRFLHIQVPQINKNTMKNSKIFPGLLNKDQVKKGAITPKNVTKWFCAPKSGAFFVFFENDLELCRTLWCQIWILFKEVILP